MSSGVAEVVAVVVLVGVLGFTVMRPRGLPEAVAAVPGALLVCLLGLVSWGSAWEHVVGMLPTVAFLAGVLVLAHLCQSEGLFDAAGHLMARRAHGRPVALLGLVFVVASLTTAVLSLDATIVLLTPVVFATAARSGVPPRPHVYATAHLSNSASLLLPVSNLTNLLAVGASGLSFAAFAAVMAAPWLVAIGVDYVVFRRFFADELALPATPQPVREDRRVPRLALVVLGLTLAGFLLSSTWGLEPFWAAIVGAAVLLVWRLFKPGGRPDGEVRGAVHAVNPSFLAFVLALSVVVQAVVDHGVADAMRRVVPDDQHLGSLLLIAAIAAVLANVVNNLPAVLVLLPLVAHGGPLAVLALLIGVNVGPNLTYLGSLATLLWRRIVAGHDHDAELAVFTRLGLLTVPVSLVLCTLALWAGAGLMGVS